VERRFSRQFDIESLGALLPGAPPWADDAVYLMIKEVMEHMLGLLSYSDCGHGGGPPRQMKIQGKKGKELSR
jgi:hypothetical protein